MSTAVAVEEACSFRELKKNPLYAERVRIYPKAVGGRFRTIRWVALIVLLGIYYIVPWLRWDRGPGVSDQAVLIDLPGRRAYFFWNEIWPQEVYYLTFLLMLGAFGSILVWLIPLALALGALGIGAFLWALRSGQFDDLDGAAERILFDDD